MAPGLGRVGPRTRAIALLPTTEGIDPGLAAIAAQGRSYSGVDYLTACGERDQLAIAMSRFHEDWDLLLTPAMPIAAFAAAWVPAHAAPPTTPLAANSAMVSRPNPIPPGSRK